MNIVDLRNSDVPVSHDSHYDRLSNDSIEFLKSIIPEYIFHNSTELVKSIHNLVWRKGIPIYLVNEKQMPDEFNIEEDNLKDDEPPTEFLGYYKYIDFGKSKCESVFLCMDRIKDDTKLAKVLVHELGHALMEAGVGDFGYNFKKNNFIKFMEESLANYIVLKYFSEINNKEMLDYSKGFIKKQGFGYNFGIKWFDYSEGFIEKQGFGYNFGIKWFDDKLKGYDDKLKGYDFWIKIKEEINKNYLAKTLKLTSFPDKFPDKSDELKIFDKVVDDFKKTCFDVNDWIDRLKNAETHKDIINL